MSTNDMFSNDGVCVECGAACEGHRNLCLECREEALRQWMDGAAEQRLKAQREIERLEALDRFEEAG